MHPGQSVCALELELELALPVLRVVRYVEGGFGIIFLWGGDVMGKWYARCL